MKTAIIISGDVRTFRDCYPSLRSCILTHNDCDLFLHMYRDENTEEVLNTYAPKKFILENKSDVSFTVPSVCKTQDAQAFGVMCQWRNIEIAFGLIDTKYDCVLKTRYDLKYTNPLMLSKFDMHLLNIPLGGDFCGGLFDMVAFGSQEVMSHYCSMFKKIGDYCANGIPCHSETLNRTHNQSAVSVQRFDYTVLLRKQFCSGYIEDRVFTIR